VVWALHSSIIQGITGSAPTPAGKVTRIGGRVDTLDERNATMTWTKPEFEVVAVTLEVTAYAATR
jgi:coenzyme PQQ precursor peptide PqqA